METHEAFSETIRRFKISLAEISRKTDISQATLSRFKNGHNDLGSRNLQKILCALPAYAREYFYTLWCRTNCAVA